ncbi:MAG: alpha/beta fold hydrolase [Alphaproteobacteria bacterium]|nr:alpha/beta fold hydrolase [Alphaproteobacteria bacterium]
MAQTNEIREETIQSPGATIYVRSARPSAKPRAVVVINHGFNSHSGQYLWVINQFVGRGFAVYAHDMRGRGKSSGPRFYVDSVDEYAQDLAATVKLAKSREPGLPVFLLGHSAGGVASCIYCLGSQSELAGFICEDFAFMVPAPDFALTVIKWLSAIAPRLPILKLKNEDFTRDPEAVRALNNDPLIANETQPAKTVAALARAADRLKKEFPRITLPLLILHGTGDKATLVKGSQLFLAEAGSKDKTLKLYEGHYHDLLNDIGKEAVFADIAAWIEKRLG